ncbi:MAG TPA: hypothetical protein VF029_00600 [Actinomycetota bacterium]
MTARSFAPLGLALCMLLGACGGTDDPARETGTVPEATGPVSAEAGSEAVLALCAMAGERDLTTAADTFHDRAHDTLHLIAAAAQEVHRRAAADLLAAKAVVESDLEAESLPAGFGADVSELVSATDAVLEAIGLPAPACPA